MPAVTEVKTFHMTKSLYSCGADEHDWGMAASDHDRLVTALRQLSPAIRKSADGAWSRAPAVRVIDCVLSLNRDYDRFVVPRRNRFERNFSRVCSISDLNSEIKKYPSADAFVRDALNYKHESRAETLANVVKWLVTKSGEGACATQLTKLESWARDTPYTCYRTLRIRGFGLAGFQYLRMLFGANTIKPDIRICEWMERVVEHRVSPDKALRLFEAAAADAKVSARDADATIWELSARSRRADSCHFSST